MQRYFIQKNITTTEFTLPPEIFHHAVNVMRNKVGAQFEIVGPDRLIKVIEVTSVQAETACGKIVNIVDVNPELPVKVTIVCGISKGDKTEKIVQKGTELGAGEFIFYNSSRSVAQWNVKKATKKVERLQKIAQNAAEQAHRVQVPVVKFCSSLSEVFENVQQSDYQLVAYEESAKQGEASQLSQVLSQIKERLEKESQRSIELTAFFGPEGGFTEAEIQLMLEHQIKACGLGPRIMRAETAPLYLLAALSFSLELG